MKRQDGRRGKGKTPLLAHNDAKGLDREKGQELTGIRNPEDSF